MKKTSFIARSPWLLLSLSLLGFVTYSPVLAKEPDSKRLRILIETDAGGDPDDEQSLVRFLLYINEWDIEGIICNRPNTRPKENLNPEPTGLGVVKRLINAYGECYPNLVKHDSRYPKAEDLLKRTVSGYANTDDAIKLLISAVDSPDPRPLWYSDWGTDKGADTNNLKRTLDLVLKDRGPEGYAKFKNRLLLSSDDKFEDHTTKIDPPFKLWIAASKPELKGQRWYHRFSAITAKAGGFDVKRDVLTNHGPLGALYPTNTTHPQKEGDSMYFLYLVPTGMNDPLQPTWGSWAGRYGRMETQKDKPYYWANEVDNWEGTIHRENTLKRWAADLQNDFRARLDWCLHPIDKANHAPVAIVNDQPGKDILYMRATPGTSLELSAKGSTDPDKDELTYNWFVYSEVSTYSGKVSMAGANSQKATVSIPNDAKDKTIHVILTVRDGGNPPLASYRRVVIQCK
jgi:hypothetical protein